MQIGFVGLGKMGLNMVTRLRRGGHAVVAFDQKADAVSRAEAVGVAGVASLDALVAALDAPRAVWVMVPAGEPTDSTIRALSGLRGSVVRSWLLELTARALAEDPGLEALEGHVEDSGEGRWTLHEGLDRAVPLPALTAALFTRFRSRENDPYSERLLAALRQQFGGHAVRSAVPPEGRPRS